MEIRGLASVTYYTGPNYTGTAVQYNTTTSDFGAYRNLFQSFQLGSVLPVPTVGPLEVRFYDVGPGSDYIALTAPYIGAPISCNGTCVGDQGPGWLNHADYVEMGMYIKSVRIYDDTGFTVLLGTASSSAQMTGAENMMESFQADTGYPDIRCLHCPPWRLP
jgi:hypothetical protein